MHTRNGRDKYSHMTCSFPFRERCGGLDGVGIQPNGYSTDLFESEDRPKSAYGSLFAIQLDIC